MVRLRAKKHEKTKATLLRSAWRLFSSKGVAAITVEQVAARAEVAVGTVYNYFGSKNGLLIALVERDIEELLRAGELILADPGSDPETAIFDLLWCYAESAMDKWGRDILRELTAASFLEPKVLGKDMTRFDYALIEQTGRLLAGLQDRGLVRKDLPLDRAALALYGTLAMPLSMFMVLEETTEDDVREHVREGVRLIFMGWHEEAV